MNENRRKLMIAALASIVLMGTFPPWIHTFTYESADSRKPAGYAFILAPPPPVRESPVDGVALDLPRLLVQWSIVLAAAGVGWLVLKE